VSDRLEAWVPRVYRFALRLSNDPDAAADLTQETFLRAWRQRDRLRDERSARVWLFRIAVNLWRDQLRRGRSPIARAESGADRAPGHEPPPEQVAATNEELARALAALNGLPARQRDVLYLSACEALTPAEVGEVLGITSEAAKANLSLARKKMRLLLPDVFPESDPVE
jgi:RNA polymerase sigma-70 factor (ECF subfamily)